MPDIIYGKYVIYDIYDMYGTLTPYVFCIHVNIGVKIPIPAKFFCWPNASIFVKNSFYENDLILDKINAICDQRSHPILKSWKIVSSKAKTDHNINKQIWLQFHKSRNMGVQTTTWTNKHDSFSHLLPHFRQFWDFPLIHLL